MAGAKWGVLAVNDLNEEINAPSAPARRAGRLDVNLTYPVQRG